jgi:ABC-type glycerol-3-phosphate transport system substrate-binding protein
MKTQKSISFIAILVGALLLTGCGNDEGTITKEKQDAIINKTGARADYKGPSKEDQEQMNKAIADYNAKQKGKKVEFTNGH